MLLLLYYYIFVSFSLPRNGGGGGTGLIGELHNVEEGDGCKEEKLFKIGFFHKVFIMFVSFGYIFYLTPCFDIILEIGTILNKVKSK